MVNFLTPFAIEVFSPIAKWLAIGIIGAIIVAGLLIFLLRRNSFAKFLRYALYSLFVLLLVLGLICLILEIAKKYDTPETVSFINGVLGSFVREEIK